MGEGCLLLEGQFKCYLQHGLNFWGLGEELFCKIVIHMSCFRVAYLLTSHRRKTAYSWRYFGLTTQFDLHCLLTGIKWTFIIPEAGRILRNVYPYMYVLLYFILICMYYYICMYIILVPWSCCCTMIKRLLHWYYWFIHWCWRVGPPFQMARLASNSQNT